MKAFATVSLLVAALGLGACSNLNTTQERMLSGGAIGAGAMADNSTTLWLP